MKNQYKQKTPVLGIPVVGDKDGIWPAVEIKKWTIVENLLLASMKGIKNCIFQEGDLSLQGDRVVLQAIGQSPSGEGVVGGAYFKAAPRVEWILPEGPSLCFLYLRGSAKTYEHPSALRPVASINRLNGSAVLFATVDLEHMKLNTRPEGKVYSGDIAKHVGDSKNPHGETLIQDEIEVQRLTVAGKQMRAPEVIDFKTAGEKGVVLTAESPVSFVQVSRRGELQGKKAGELSVGYFGSDQKVVNPEDFVVYNDGDAELQARALIF